MNFMTETANVVEALGRRLGVGQIRGAKLGRISEVAQVMTTRRRRGAKHITLLSP